MKLISLHIDNFGQFNNFDYVFEDGINQIIEENGWGKSTLAAFIVEVLHLRLIISSIQYTVPLKLKIRTIPLSL